MLVRLVCASLTAGYYAVEAVDKAICLLPPGRAARGCLLDTLLGSAEDFEYVSTTAPSSPPPTIS